MSDSAEHDDETAPPPLPAAVPSAESIPADAPGDEPDTLTGVVAMIRERGFITTGELFAAFPTLEPDTDELRKLYEAIEARGGTVLDEIAEKLNSDVHAAADYVVEPDEPARRRVTEHRPS